eukprot:877837_1
MSTHFTNRDQKQVITHYQYLQVNTTECGSFYADDMRIVEKGDMHETPLYVQKEVMDCIRWRSSLIEMKYCFQSNLGGHWQIYVSHPNATQYIISVRDYAMKFYYGNCVIDVWRTHLKIPKLSSIRNIKPVEETTELDYFDNPIQDKTHKCIETSNTMNELKTCIKSGSRIHTHWNIFFVDSKHKKYSISKPSNYMRFIVDDWELVIWS